MISKKLTGCLSEDDIPRAVLSKYNARCTMSQMYSVRRDTNLSPWPAFTLMETWKYLNATHTWSMVIMSHEAAKHFREIAKNSSVFMILDNTDVSVKVRGDNELEKSIMNSQRGADSREESNLVKAPKPHPTGTKHALEICKEVGALRQGAQTIKKIAETARNKCKIAEELLELDKQRSMIGLFIVPGIDEGL